MATTYQYQVLASAWDFVSVTTLLNQMGALGWQAIAFEWQQGNLGQVWIVFQQTTVV